MDDPHSNSLLPPRTQDAFSTPTPSGLTPNTRQEAEFVFEANAMAQTDAAAPAKEDLSEAQRAYRRPDGPVRASSTKYESALRAARGQESAPSDLVDETTTDTPGEVTSSSTLPFALPPPGQGVVPNYDAINSGQTDAVKKERNRGLSLSQLGRQQSWNEQDMKHMLQGPLMERADGAVPGYESGAEKE
ncbi:hypothetical protein BU23DRAFT_551504 [Bimuria novae-zelandiae CBS 107.79]|uniref:Uncharacterized protein n=1 Tax=Bimuria novae-zelandiae CBS 107.79 TaxID=1447943 RepID=A0A6A5VTJ1_9PLEO|nr:hypothetical protein BU23DRAFT_551504 [Bimuria novae-zelandiae CBS 107.79]